MGFLPLSVTKENSSSIYFVPQMALASDTPILSESSLLKSSPLSLIAISPATTPNCTYLSIRTASSCKPKFKRVKVPHLSGNAGIKHRNIKAIHQPHRGFSLNHRLIDIVLANAVRRNHPNSGYHYASFSHNLFSLLTTTGRWNFAFSGCFLRFCFTCSRQLKYDMASVRAGYRIYRIGVLP